MKQLRKTANVLILLLAFSLVGCGASRQVELTPEQEKDRLYYEQKDMHNQAVEKFAKALGKYNVWCGNPMYDDACAACDGYWDKANTALDTWGVIIDNREPISGSDDAYQTALKRLKTEMLMKIPEFQEW